MYQLRALVWKTCKVRLRSYLTTALDVLGPIVCIIVYLVMKAVLSSLEGSYIANTTKPIPYKSINPRSDINRHMCNKVLFNSYDSGGSNDFLVRAINDQCGVELIQVSSKELLMEKLQTSIASRVEFKQNSDLNRSNSSSGCFTLPGSNETIYQAGLVIESQSSYQIHLTDMAHDEVIFHPLPVGSVFNEYRFPQSSLNSGHNLLEICVFKALGPKGFTQEGDQNKTDIKWQLKAFSETASTQTLFTLFLVFQMLGNLCSCLGSVIRVTDDIESGFHRYIRAAGVPAITYWMSHIIITTIHLAIQSLIIGILLALPIGNNLYDIMYETNITIRWSMIFAYSLAINVHAMFVSASFDRTQHAILIASLLGCIYSMYTVTFLLQWDPYGFRSFGYTQEVALIVPTPAYMALSFLAYGISLQTNEPINWSHLPMKIAGGGVTGWTLGGIWLFMTLSAIFWFVLMVARDQIWFSSTLSPIGLFVNIANENCCSTAIGLGHSEMSEVKTLSSNVGAKSQKDPNRICCSMRHVTAYGPTVSVAHTKGDPLKLKPEQMSKLHLYEKQASKTFHITRSRQSDNRSKFDDPILLDEALLQHIVWHRTKIVFEDMSIDFRFNQLTFILGQTDLKELFFEILTGMSGLRSGHIILDETRYSASTMSLARPHVGYLGERDVFIPEMSIFENLQFFGSLRNSTYDQYDSESLFLLNLLHLMKRKNDFPVTLTSRSARKLALAVAAVGHTKLLLLVEPTLNLRWRPRCQVLNLLKKYKSIRSIIVDTSDVDEATAFGDRIVLLKNGGTDLDGHPEQLNKKLTCGHWIVFEAVDKKQNLSESIKTLDKLTSIMFKQDKLGPLEVSQRKAPMKISGARAYPKTTSKSPARDSKANQEKPGATVVLLKVRHSINSTQTLLALLKMFSQTTHGFRLLELKFESLEDILVSRMSKAAYPDLPPDLLLSLQHRTQIKPETPTESPQINVRRLSDELPKTSRPVFGAKISILIKDRASNSWELILVVFALLVSLLIVGLMLWSNKASLELGSIKSSAQNNQEPKKKFNLESSVLESTILKKLYQKRIGLYIEGENDNSSSRYLNQWNGIRISPGSIAKNQSGSDIITSIVLAKRSVLVAIVFYEPKSGRVSVVFEPHLQSVLGASINAFNDYHYSLVNTYETNRGLITSQHVFRQPWHESIRGFLSRRFYYGVGFGIAEGVAMGALVVAPIRHRSESRSIRVRSGYWIGMAIFDMIISSIFIICHTTLIIWIERIHQISLIICIMVVFFLFKLASLPIVYMVSIACDASWKGFLFIAFFYVVVVWSFGINLKTFIECTLVESYMYLISSWMLMLVPISSLTDALSIITQISRIDQLCGQIPAYVATRPIVELVGPQRINLVDSLLDKVHECLANGKNGISTNVLHLQRLGIIWQICLIVFFGIIIWIFLLCSERVFGVLTKRFTSARTSNDPLKTIIRSSEQNLSLFKWDREKDRLVSEYIRCLNEISYVKQMEKNCLYLRAWLKPMSDQYSINKSIAQIAEPLFSLGQARHDIQVELRTTLQLFIRIGNEINRCKFDKVQLIETYSKHLKEHGDTVIKFAIVDWTQEVLYKILLHGHYNTKSN